MRTEHATPHDGRRGRVVYTDLTRTGPRRSYETTPGRTVTGTVHVGRTALSVDDERGRMMKCIALGLVETIEEVA